MFNIHILLLVGGSIVFIACGLPMRHGSGRQGRLLFPPDLPGEGCHSWVVRSRPGMFGRCESGSAVSLPAKLVRAHRRILTSSPVHQKPKLRTDRP